MISMNIAPRGQRINALEIYCLLRGGGGVASHESIQHGVASPNIFSWSGTPFVSVVDLYQLKQFEVFILIGESQMCLMNLSL